jgi:hypothetical protein
LALGDDAYIVRALTENPMEILARADDTTRRCAIAVDAMSTVADAPNSKAAITSACTFDAGHFTVRRYSWYRLAHTRYLSFSCFQVNPEIAPSGASAKVKLPKPVFSRSKMR